MKDAMKRKQQQQKQKENNRPKSSACPLEETNSIHEKQTLWVVTERDC